MTAYLENKTWASEQDLLADWEHDRLRHPFFVEGLDEKRINENWERSSKNYKGIEYASIRDEIAKDLISDGILGPESEVLDIGCGPGLYDILFSPSVRSVHCTDASPGLIERLKADCARLRISNVSGEAVSWEDMKPSEPYDVVFSSLCPALNDPASILRMECFSGGWCVYVSSADPVPWMPLEVWSRLGLDCSFCGYDTHYPYEFLRMRGRSPKMKFYSSRTETVQTREEALGSLLRYMANYRTVTPELERIAGDVVDSHVSGGKVKQCRRLTLGMLVWHIPQLRQS